MKIQNPILPGFYPDPSVCRVGEDFYLVNSSFEYFPGVPIFHSKDMVHWQQIGHCLTRPSQLPLENARASGGIYAPTIRYHQGTFYMVTTNVSNGGHFYVSSTDPAGEWSEPVWVTDPAVTDPSFQFDEVGIDPSFLFDDDGTVYFTTNGPAGLRQSVIDLKTGHLLSPRRVIWSGESGQYPEGPHLYKINGMYYLMAAEGGTEYCHMETIARSQSPWGPFEACPFNPILTHRGYFSPISGTGHADMVEAQDGKWWLVCLAYRPVGYPRCYHLGRETYLAPVKWDADGWPVVGEDGRIQIEFNAETLPINEWPARQPRDDFNEAHLGMTWNYLRNPDMKNYSLSERPGWLRLKGSPATINDIASPTFVGRRQQHFNTRISTLVDFVPNADGDEAGLTVLMNDRHHYEIAITCRQGKRQVIVRRRIGSLEVVVASQPVDSNDPLTLMVDSDKEWYTFKFKDAAGEVVEMAKAETRYLSIEVAGMFTGVYAAMYATGNGKECSVPADFDWFEYQSLPD
jgi:xylan 1,4-beta-xylosidase